MFLREPHILSNGYTMLNASLLAALYCWPIKPLGAHNVHL